MPLTKITSVTNRCLPLPGTDIDTDRIIPARFLKCITFDDLANVMFWDERFHTDGTSKNHPVDDARYAGAGIILSGENFGCGSSREHAPQTLKRSEINAVIAESFAEIFFGNSTGIGLPCVCASPADLAQLMTAVTANATLEITLDLLSMTASWEGHSIKVSMPETAREALTSGRWDAVAELLGNEEAVDSLAAALGYATEGSPK